MKLNKIMLRSLLLVICGALIAPCAWAQVGGTPSLYVADLDGFKVTSPTGAPGDVWTTFEALEEASLTLRIVKNFDSQTGQQSSESVTVGCYTYNYENGTINVTGYEVFEGLQTGDEFSTAGLLEIKAGDMVGMWVERDEGVNSTLFLTPGSGKIDIPGVPPGKVNTAPGVFYTVMNMEGNEEGHAHFEFVQEQSATGNYDLVVSMQGVPAASGVPLPGVVATVMLCGAVGGYFNRRKKGVSPE